MVSKTYIKNVKMSPKKMRFMLELLKGMSPLEAVRHLEVIPNKQATLFYKAIQSAISNATATLKADPNVLKFKLLTIEEGRKLKRYKAGSRGGAKPRTKRSSHIKIELVANAVENDKPKQVQKKKIVPKTKKAPKKANTKKKVKTSTKKTVKKTT